MAAAPYNSGAPAYVYMPDPYATGPAMAAVSETNNSKPYFRGGPTTTDDDAPQAGGHQCDDPEQQQPQPLGGFHRGEEVSDTTVGHRVSDTVGRRGSDSHQRLTTMANPYAVPSSYQYAVTLPDGVSIAFVGNIETRGSHSSLLGRPYDLKCVPSVPPPVTDDTPDVWFQVSQAERKEAAEQKEAERLGALRQKKVDSEGGVGYKFSKFFSNAGAGVGKTVTDASQSREKSAWDGNVKQAKDRMLKYWPYQPQDGFVVEFDAYGIHNNIPTRGHILLTHTSFLFLGKGNDGKLVIVEDIPLADVLSYSKGMSVPCNEKGRKWVMDLPALFVKADALQLYTRQGVLFQFTQFSHSLLGGDSTIIHTGPSIHDGHEEVGCLDRFINYFDHVWRAARSSAPSDASRHEPRPKVAFENI